FIARSPEGVEWGYEDPGAAPRPGRSGRLDAAQRIHSSLPQTIARNGGVAGQTRRAHPPPRGRATPPGRGKSSRMRHPFRPIRDLFRQPAMIGTPPSRRPMWHDPAQHARDFAERYAEPLDRLVAVRMEELGLSKEQIGMPDDDRGIPWAAF